MPFPLSLIQFLPTWLGSLIIEWVAKDLLNYENIDCQLKTISEVIQEHNLNKINLLKIDVEKSELKVLLGIIAHDWSKIKQIIVEVHDIDNRVEHIKAMLQEKGFTKIKLDQEEYLKPLNIFSIYATK